MTQPKYAPACPHDPLVEIFPNIYFLHGSIKIGPGLRMNRNMIVIKQHNGLSLINPVRINDAELLKLDQLGKVQHVIRLGDFHGLDDQFYIDRYKAEFWSQRNHETYNELIPTRVINAESAPPFDNAEFFIFKTALYPEAAIFIKPLKLLITTDSIQYWADWSYFTFPTKVITNLMGFRLGLLIGGPWIKRVTPKGKSLKQDFEQLLKLDFDHLVAAHGSVLRSEAKKRLTETVRKQFP